MVKIIFAAAGAGVERIFRLWSAEAAGGDGIGAEKVGVVGL